ncbi:Methyltransferase type 11 [Desulfurobacterium thermolithotrophum DSM 11699]|uniref:Methyltransferase type 11 n=1 Tax=Desulfurobacterium thermolithotrophum (strain DSM 11699 / BSA) TaxID=868864 RepID=F0S170_DESTD|nr:methyltransferase domain-containing protein [Desulfurobacterium thermolithotrophum]ADY73948.1 Methyltransferase type 11 [Desulfurobacterium thermolithotrophum DSM 11699]
MIKIKSLKVSSKVLLSKVEEEVSKIYEIESKREVPLEDSSKKTDEYVYTIEDFVKYHDVEFVRFAYRTILGREPDKDGLNHYLRKLRNGEYTKTDIIVRLRYSKEGRKRNVKILGLKKRALYAFLSGIPVVGYLLKILKFFITVPRFMRHINALESYIHYHMNHANQRFESLQNHINQSIINLEQKVGQRFAEVNSRLAEIDKINNRLSELDIEISNLHRSLIETKNVLQNSLSIQDVRISNLENRFFQIDLPKELEINVELNIDKDKNYYSAFENVFRGERKEIKKRQEKYLKYVPEECLKNYPVLDAGCGRGEFLELLKEKGIEAIGVDINEEEVQILKEKGFKVVNTDINSFLKETEQEFSAIVSFQVIEHLQRDYLKEFLQLSHKKLVNGGAIILETVNPWNYEAFARFYIDETHVRPIPPDTLSFMLRWIGFKDIKIVFSAPLKEKRYKDEDPKKLYFDYAIIGYKRDES